MADPRTIRELVEAYNADSGDECTCERCQPCEACGCQSGYCPDCRVPE